jgi:hypothetical protein
MQSVTYGGIFYCPTLVKDVEHFESQLLFCHNVKVLDTINLYCQGLTLST